jgi:chromosome segregation ATPase
MSGKGYDELKILYGKIDELIAKFNKIKSDYEEIKSLNEVLESKLGESGKKIKELEIKNERFRLSGALLGEGENAGEAKRKINELVREIDKCVALLNR